MEMVRGGRLVADGWCRHTVAGLHYTGADPGISRLPKGHRTVGKRLWDEVMQKMVLTEACGKVLWQTITEDRFLWSSLYFELLATDTGRQREAPNIGRPNVDSDCGEVSAGKKVGLGSRRVALAPRARRGVILHVCGCKGRRRSGF